MGRWEDLRIWPEVHLGAASVCRPHHLQRRNRTALGELHLVLSPIPVYRHEHLDRSRVHTANTDPVQSARDLIALAIELAAGMENRHHHFKSGDVSTMLLRFGLMPVNGDPPSIVFD